jgi:adenylate cyclase
MQVGFFVREIPLRIFSKILNIGNSGLDEATRRKVRIFNGFIFVVVLNTLLIVLPQYMALGWSQHKYLITWTWIMAISFALTPLFYRFGPSVPYFYFSFAGWLGFVVQGYITGNSLGSHFYLLVAPTALLFFGATRWRVSLLTTIFVLSGVYIVQFIFPANSFEPVPYDSGITKQKISLFGSSFLIFGALYYALQMAERAEAALAKEYARSEFLLQNLMPSSIAERLKDRPDQIIADSFDSVTILFADIVNFTPRASHLSPTEIVGFLNRIFSEFDKLAEKYELEKIKTIGDAYMVAGGMPDLRTGHADAVAEMALGMLEVTELLSKELGEKIEVRIGIHTGPAIAGVIGTRKMFYDVWGDTVNTASRMESHGSAGKIQVTEEARKVLADRYAFEPRGTIDVKGKGAMELFYLAGRKAGGVEPHQT